MPILAHVHLAGQGIQGVNALAAGAGVSHVRTTGPTGHAPFLLSLTRPGILTLSIDRAHGCPDPPPVRIGVLGAFQPPRPIVTG